MEIRYVPDEVLVKLKKGVGYPEAIRLAADYNCRLEECVATIRLCRLKILDGREVSQVVETLSKDPRVEYAEPNFLDYPAGPSNGNPAGAPNPAKPSSEDP
jgi:hypothetical protein